jgi:hypothetical protein
VHLGGGATTNGQVVASPFQFFVKVSVVGGSHRVALGDAEVIIGGAMLADVLVRRAEVTMVVGGQFGE